MNSKRLTQLMYCVLNIIYLSDKMTFGTCGFYGQQYLDCNLNANYNFKKHIDHTDSHFKEFYDLKYISSSYYENQNKILHDYNIIYSNDINGYNKVINNSLALFDNKDFDKVIDRIKLFKKVNNLSSTQNDSCVYMIGLFQSYKIINNNSLAILRREQYWLTIVIAMLSIITAIAVAVFLNK
jgi:hypothetical protein